MKIVEGPLSVKKKQEEKKEEESRGSKRVSLDEKKKEKKRKKSIRCVAKTLMFYVYVQDGDSFINI